MQMSKKAQLRGFSLIELLLVLGIVSGILVLAFVAYPKVQATSRAKAEAEHLTFISGGIKNLYATAKNFGTAGANLNQVLLNAKIIPDDLQVSGATINNTWGGNVVVAVDSTPLRYTITYTNVPTAECSKIGTTVAANYLKLTINGATIFDRTAGSTGAADIDPALVAANCAGSTGSTMVFTGN